MSGRPIPSYDTCDEEFFDALEYLPGESKAETPSLDHSWRLSSSLYGCSIVSNQVHRKCSERLKFYEALGVLFDNVEWLLGNDSDVWLFVILTGGQDNADVISPQCSLVEQPACSEKSSYPVVLFQNWFCSHRTRDYSDIGNGPSLWAICCSNHSRPITRSLYQELSRQIFTFPPDVSLRLVVDATRETNADGLQSQMDNVFSTQIFPWRSSIAPVAGGRFSDVYSGTLASGVRVAISCVRTRRTDDAAKIHALIVHESSFWANINHPNVLALYGVGWYDGKLALVTPWMGNGNLRQYVHHNPGANRWEICRQLAGALDYLHKFQVVHGDLKTTNVFVSDEGVPKLGDFGKTARFESMFTDTCMQYDEESVRWGAPELITVESVGSVQSTASDVYALGMTILEVMTGRKPFHEYKSMASVAIAVIQGKQPSRPSELVADSWLGDEIWQMLVSCWSFEVGSRATASEINDFFSTRL